MSHASHVITSQNFDVSSHKKFLENVWPSYTGYKTLEFFGYKTHTFQLAADGEVCDVSSACQQPIRIPWIPKGLTHFPSSHLLTDDTSTPCKLKMLQNALGHVFS